MTSINYYINFCKFFHNFKSPKLRFKQINENYKSLYQNYYQINEDDINKASFFIFLLSFSASFVISLIFIAVHFLIIILSSLFFSLIVSSRFNLTLYNIIKKDENKINALLYLIKINFSLVKNTLSENSDMTMVFINLIKNFHLPISENFKLFLARIHEGEIPENELLKLTTPSEDFNSYLENLLINNFNYEKNLNEIEETNLEKNFRIILRDIEAKISIVFFIGLFFPIGLCFLILFQQIHYFLMILFIPLFFILLNFLYKKLIKIDVFLIGLLNEYSDKERRKFEEFLFFLKSFAIHLRTNISPEMAFIKSYSQNKENLKILRSPINNQVSNLLSFSGSFSDIIELLKSELSSIRYNLILDSIEKMIYENAYFSSNKIFEILDIISQHRRLESKLGIIIKGEKFKVFLFLFLLPIIIGAIGGMFPFVVTLTNNQDINLTSFSSSNYSSLINILLIFLTLLFSNLTSSYYFLKIVHYEEKSLMVILSCTIYILVFFLTLINLTNII